MSATVWFCMHFQKTVEQSAKDGLLDGCRHRLVLEDVSKVNFACCGTSFLFSSPDKRHHAAFYPNFILVPVSLKALTAAPSPVTKVKVLERIFRSNPA